MKPPATVAVFRALQLGDTLCALPALRALRQSWPEARITLIGLPWAATFASRFPHLVDAFIPFPGHPSLPETPFDAAAQQAFTQRLNETRFDLALQMHGDGRVTNAIVESFGSARTVGFAPSGPGSADQLPYRDEGHEIRRLLRLVEHLGLPAAGEHLEFPVTVAERAGARRLLAGHGLSGRPFAVIHPGSRAASRRWPASGFAAVADSLSAQGVSIVLTGSAEERPITAAVRSHMRETVIDFSGQTDVGTLAALLQQAELLVCNDTGVSHVAAAVRAPSVVLFSGSDPARWAPPDAALHRPVSVSAASVTPGQVAAILREADALPRRAHAAV